MLEMCWAQEGGISVWEDGWLLSEAMQPPRGLENSSLEPWQLFPPALYSLWYEGLIE